MPKNNDIDYVVEGVKFIIDKETSQYAKGFHIDCRDSIFGKRITVNELYRRSSC